MDIIILHNFFSCVGVLSFFFTKAPPMRSQGGKVKKITTHNISPIGDSAFRWPRFFFYCTYSKNSIFFK